MADETRIKENLKLLSFPRLSGTENEKKALNIVKKKIEDLNLKSFIQRFSFSTFYSRIYPKIAFSLIFLLFSILVLNIQEKFIDISFIIISLILISLFIFTRKPEKIKLGHNLNSQNLFVKFSNENVNKDILLFSHLDSKKQRLPVNIRIFSFKLWLFSFLGGTIIILLRLFIINHLFFWFYLIGVIILAINGLATLLIIINTSHNKSPGAIDNASGVSCVLEILNHFSKPGMRLKNYNLWFVFTGAEECGTMGIRHFYNENMKHLDKNRSYVINFDSIGVGDLSYWSIYINPKKNYDLYRVFLKKAEVLDLKFEFHDRAFGFRSDGLYLRSKGFHGFGFGGSGILYKYVHTINDTVDKVDTSLLEKLSKYVPIILKEIDNKY